MAMDLSKYGNWNGLFNSLSYAAPNSDSGANGGYSQNGVSWQALYGDNPMISTGSPDQGQLSGFFVPSSADGSGYNTVLTKNADGSIGQQQVAAHMSNSLLDKIIQGITIAGNAYIGAEAGAAALGAAGATGAGSAGAAEGGSAGWTSGYDIGTGGSLGEGYGTAASAAGAGSSGASTATGSGASGAGETTASTTSTGGQASFSDAGYDAQNGISSDWTGSGSASPTADSMWQSVPQGVKDYATNKAVGAAAGGLLSGVSSATAPNSLTSTSQSQIDPRMSPYIYGPSGILNQASNALATPQNPGLLNFGNATSGFLGSTGQQDINNIYAASNSLMNGGVNAPTSQAAQVAAPSQNNVDLSSSYQGMISGQPGNNPYLTGAIQKGINQSNNAFGNYVTDATKAVQDQMAGIRGGAVINGAYGGNSRQGIAEGRALSDFGSNLTRAATQYGQNNTDAAVSAQAGAYNDDQNRALSAMNGLGAQQYGLASQNAQLQQQSNLANVSSQLSTDSLNTSRQQAGISANSGLLNSLYTYGTNQDSYDLNKLGKVSGLISPYTGLNSSTTATQPLYQNTAANVLGGAATGASVAGLISKFYS